MTRRRLRHFAGILCMFVGTVWTLAAPWISAHEFITVMEELIAYQFSFVLTAMGAFLYIPRREDRDPDAVTNRSIRIVYAALALLTCLVAILLSDKAFFHWKFGTIPTNAWPQMVADLTELGKRQAAMKGFNQVHDKNAVPVSLRQLGPEFSGASGQMLDVPAYQGVIAFVDFGYKVRSWGLFIGPESNMKRWTRGGPHVQVATNAYFYAGWRD